MTPEELTNTLVGHLLMHAGRKTEGPYHDPTKQKSVVYVTTYDGTRLRVEVSKP